MTTLRRCRQTVARAAVALLPAALPACAQDPRADSPFPSDADTVVVNTNEATLLSLDVSRDGGSIVMDLLDQLWLLPASGGVAQPITRAVEDTAEDQDPSFSPDGRHVVFRAERAGRFGLWLLDLESMHASLLVAAADAESPVFDAAWSPSGDRIAFARVPPRDSAGGQRASRIAITDLATHTARTLRVEGVPNVDLRSPAWTHDGRIAFVVLDDRRGAGWPGGRIWIVDAAGATAEPVTPSAVHALAPAFSPDGRRLAFMAPDSSGSLQVWVHRFAGRGAGVRPVRLTNHRDVAPTRVRWSAEGRSILYSADGRIQRIDADGGEPIEIPFEARLAIARAAPRLPPVRFPEPGVEQEARGFMGLALSPDARSIGIIALGRLWIVPVGGQARAIADVPHTARYLAWSPDGRELAYSAGPAEDQDLFATDVQSGTTRKLTALPGSEVYPAYSPDGQSVSFAHMAAVNRLRAIPSSSPVVSDTADTRNLGAAEIEWTGADVYTYQWSPDSDALLRVDVNFGGPTTGMLVALSGDTSRVRLPDAPNHLRWTRDGLVWARHDRLWSAPFDRRGVVGEPTPLGDAPAMYPSVALDGTILYVSADGLTLRSPAGAERSLGWPLRFTPPVPPPVLIRNVRIIDGTGAPATAPRDLLIEKGRIVRIAPAGSIAAGSRRILDARERFAIPGLLDLHAHTYWPELLPGFLYFGITLVRDQGAPIAPVAAYADAIAAATLPGPRVSYGAFQLYSDWSYDDESGRGVEPEADPGHVARVLALAEAFGAHHIKVRTFRRWDIYTRFIAQAHQRGLRVTGHCVQQLPLVAAAMDAKEHVGLCPRRGSLRPLGDMTHYADVDSLMRAAGIPVVPTIAYFSFAARLNEHPDLIERDSSIARFVPPGSFGWMLGLDRTGREIFARAAAHARETTSRLARAGVAIGTGTDIWQVPTGVHMELEELVTAGLSPMQALVAATSGAARIAGVDADLGTIEVGKLADLVLLDADPLIDIRNTHGIWAVVKGGTPVDRTDIAGHYRFRR